MLFVVLQIFVKTSMNASIIFLTLSVLEKVTYAHGQFSYS